MTWRYTTRSPIQGWQNVDFDDASWNSGPSPFGVGGAANTEWSQRAGDKIWLRKEFDLSDAVDSGVFLHALAHLGIASQVTGHGPVRWCFRLCEQETDLDSIWEIGNDIGHVVTRVFQPTGHSA